VNNNTFCKCNAGWYSANAPSSDLSNYNQTCNNCGQGSYCEGGSHKKDCDAGTASSDMNATMSSQCSPCGLGFYQNAAGQSSCKSCVSPKETGSPSATCLNEQGPYDCGFTSCGKKFIKDKHGSVDLGFLIQI
jgi:hypothetical protein